MLIYSYEVVALKRKSAFGILLFALVGLLLCGIFVYTAERNADLMALSNFADKRGMTVIIDAGHGGADGGTVATDGTPEKDFNLKIAQKLNTQLKALGIKTVMTRNSDISIHDPDKVGLRAQKVSDIHNRMKMMENTENAVFVSIHQNHFPNQTLWGTQVFYSPNTTESAALADYIQNTVISMLQPNNKRIIKKSGTSIYLLYYAKKTAVLVECGFLSNPTETKKLNDEKYQNQMAFAIACGIMNYLSDGI